MELLIATNNSGKLKEFKLTRELEKKYSKNVLNKTLQ